MSLIDTVPNSTVSLIHSNHTIYNAVFKGLIYFEIVLLVFIILMSLAWFCYYVNHALLMRQKIYLLKYHADTYMIDRLINSQVDYCRSRVISAILLSSIVGYLCLILEGIYTLQLPSKTLIHNCTVTFPFNLAHDSNAFRIFLSPSSIISAYVTLSLLVILTSYLQKAYSTRRAIILTEKKLFVWMCTEAAIVLLVHVTWRSYIVLNPVITALGVIKLYMLFKYTNRLLRVLKDRFGCAINEAQKQLEVNMRKLYIRYLLGTRALFIYVVCYITINGVVNIFERVRLFLTSDCALRMVFGTHLHVHYDEPHLWILLSPIGRVLQDMLYIIMLLLLFLLHIGLFQVLICQICCRRLQRKSKQVTFTNGPITQPLLHPNT